MLDILDECKGNFRENKDVKRLFNNRIWRARQRCWNIVPGDFVIKRYQPDLIELKEYIEITKPEQSLVMKEIIEYGKGL